MGFQKIKLGLKMAKKKKYAFCILLIFIFCNFLLSAGLSQQEVISRDQYQIGADERLMITVHVFGEVKKPGEYVVADNTNILELISKAGGPTEFSNLSKIKITRGLVSIDDVKKAYQINRNQNLKIVAKQVISINLKKMLDSQSSMSTLPILRPGDVVRVGRNASYAWQTAIRIISQLAIVAQVWYWYNN